MAVRQAVYPGGRVAQAAGVGLGRAPVTGLIRCTQAWCPRSFGGLTLVRTLDELRFRSEAHGWTNYPAEGGGRADYCPAHS